MGNDSDEGRIYLSNSNISTPRYQFFIADHLGNTRLIVERQSANTAVFQTTDYGAWGEILENVTGATAGDWKTMLYQGNEYIDFLGYNTYDFNARQYDPYLGRFDSLDPKTQFASGYIGMGNVPSIGIDPDGQWVHLLIGAVIGGLVNWGTHGFQLNAKGLGYFGVGALAGALSAGIGAGVNVAMAGGSFGAGFLGTATGVASTGFLSGAATGVATGFTNGFVSGTGNGLLGGNSFSSSLGSGLQSGAVQGLFGGITGGINAASKDLNFWNGTAKLDLSNGVGAHGIIPNDPITGKYVGKFDGVDVYESSQLGTGYGSGGITLPGRGITVGKYAFSNKLDMQLVAHEFGHTRQIEQLGAFSFLKDVGMKVYQVLLFLH